MLVSRSETRQASQVEVRVIDKAGRSFGGIERVVRLAGGEALQANRHQPVALLLARVARGLQLVAQHHQLVHLGDDTELLRERRQWERKIGNNLSRNLPKCCP